MGQPRLRTVMSLSALALGLGLVSCSDDAPENPPPDPPVAEAVVPAPGGLKRLTSRQYKASVKVLFGAAAAEQADPPADTQVFGLESIGAVQHAVTPAGTELYELSARNIAAAVIEDTDGRGRVLICAPSSIDDTGCFAKIAERSGRLAWRRTLTEEEVGLLVSVATTAAAEHEDADQGVAAMISTLLQAPDFLYQVIIGDEDAQTADRRLLRPEELATRISFFVLGHTPDAALLDRAANGQLADEAGIRETVTGLLARSEARSALRGFYEELLDLRTIMEVQKDPERFPLFVDATRAAIAEETLLFLDDIIWARNSDAREMFDADFTFVNQDNAWIYGLNVTTESFQRVQVEDRIGLLSKPSFLARKAHSKLTSPTRRGLFILTTLLCDPVPPPVEANPTLPDGGDGPQTMREKLALHATGTCKTCHSQMDPLGLSLEHFDAVGRWQEKDQGLEIDTSGEVKGLGTFDDYQGVAGLLRQSEDSPVCMARQIYRQSMGHLEVDGEEPALLAIEEAFSKSGYSLQNLILEIAASPAFRLVGEPR